MQYSRWVGVFFRLKINLHKKYYKEIEVTSAYAFLFQTSVNVYKV